MRKIFVATIVTFIIRMAVFANGTDVRLTDMDISEVRSNLLAFDKGRLSLEEVTERGGEEWGNKLTAYYEMYPDAVTIKMKLPISRCYAAMGKYSKAAALANDYIGIYSNDWHAWRIIGSANIYMKDLAAAVHAYTNAVRLGDDGSCTALAYAATEIGRLDLVKEIVPRLFILKESRPTQYIKPLDAVTVLVLYSLKSNQEKIFGEALQGVNASDILSRSDLEFLIKQGCEQFKGKDVDKIREELNAASGNSSKPSTTNASSP